MKAGKGSISRSRRCLIIHPRRTQEVPGPEHQQWVLHPPPSHALGGKRRLPGGYLPPAEVRKLKWLILGLKFLHQNLHPTSTKRALYQKLPQYTGTFHSAEGLMGAKPNTHFQSLSVHVTEPSTRLPLVPDHIRLDRNTG